MPFGSEMFLSPLLHVQSNLDYPDNRESGQSIARVFKLPTWQELIKHEILLATKQLHQSDISWTHQNISVSSHLRNFEKQPG